MSLDQSEVASYLNPTTRVALATQPLIKTGEDGAPKKITGICEGRVVAYWPTHANAYGRPPIKQDDGSFLPDPYASASDGKLRAMGANGYIPAMIVASWASSPTECPCANLKLFLDPSNHREAIREHLDGASSCRYSEFPAQGCWTWIPKS